MSAIGGRAAGRTMVAVLAIAVCMSAAIALQVARNRLYAGQSRETERILYIQSGTAAKRLALDFDALWADVYWIRAIQHYGGDRLGSTREKKYELLYPLVDLTTTLDPYFTIAYRFGAIFLSEAAPGGPGRPDQAIALLAKGIGAQPGKWQYPHDIGFVYYWHLRDFANAAQWFERAASYPNAPNWLKPLAAGVLTAGNDRATARALWGQIRQSEEDWLRKTAERSLAQLDALDAIDQLQAVIRRFPLPEATPYSWEALVRRGVLRGIPLDPSGVPFDIAPADGAVSVSPRSRLFPMPDLVHSVPR